jgi:hypothetical protein
MHVRGAKKLVIQCVETAEDVLLELTSALNLRSSKVCYKSRYIATQQMYEYVILGH